MAERDITDGAGLRAVAAPPRATARFAPPRATARFAPPRATARPGACGAIGLGGAGTEACLFDASARRVRSRRAPAPRSDAAALVEGLRAEIDWLMEEAVAVGADLADARLRILHPTRDPGCVVLGGGLSRPPAADRPTGAAARHALGSIPPPGIRDAPYGGAGGAHLDRPSAVAGIHRHAGGPLGRAVATAVDAPRAALGLPPVAIAPGTPLADLPARDGALRPEPFG